MPYTLLDQAALHTGMAACVKRDVSVIIGAPFSSGILVTGSRSGATYGYAAAPEAVQAKVRAIEEVCDAHGVALGSAAMAFPLAHPAVAAIIPGAAKPEEITAEPRRLRQADPGRLLVRPEGEGPDRRGLARPRRLIRRWSPPPLPCRARR